MMHQHIVCQPVAVCCFLSHFYLDAVSNTQWGSSLTVRQQYALRLCVGSGFCAVVLAASADSAPQRGPDPNHSFQAAPAAGAAG